MKTGSTTEKVLAMIDTYQVSGPTRGLFQIVERAKDSTARFILSMFLVGSQSISPAIQEARRRGFQIEVLYQRGRYDISLIPQALRIIRQNGVTVLQSHNYKPAFLAWCLRAVTGLPWVAFAHGYTSGNPRLSLYNSLDRWLMTKADRVVVVADALGRLLSDSGVSRDRIRVIHNTIDPDDYSLNAVGDKFRRQIQAGQSDLLVGVIGRLSREKGQSVFIRAFQSVAQALPEAKAVLVGEGPELLALQAEVKLAGLSDRVRFAGYHNNISPVYAGLDLVVIPSFSEGLPNVLLEALLHKKAVIATAVGGIPEVLKDKLSKWLVPSGDAGALSQAIIETLRNPSVRHQLGEIGERYVQDAFAPSIRAEKVLGIYRELVNC